MGAQAAMKGMPLAGPYCTSKIAVHTLTKIIALENEGNITCNALVPGIIDTPSNRRQMQGPITATGRSRAKLPRKLKSYCFLIKMGH